MDNPQQPSIDFTPESPVASSDVFRVSEGQDSSAAASGAAARQVGVPLDRLPLQLQLDEFIDRPVAVEIRAGRVDIAQLGVEVVVNGKRLSNCQATVSYHVSLPARDFKVGDNQIELVRAPLLIQKVSVGVPKSDGHEKGPGSGLPFDLTLPDIK